MNKYQKNFYVHYVEGMRPVIWSLKSLANMLQNWFPCSNQLRSVWIFLKKCAHVVEPIPEQFKNQWLKSGVMYPQMNLV